MGTQGSWAKTVAIKVLCVCVFSFKGKELFLEKETD